MKIARLVFRCCPGFFLFTLVLVTGWLFYSNPALGQVRKTPVTLNNATQGTATHWVYLPVIKGQGSCPQTVCNGGFENGPDGFWTITSTNFLEDFVLVNLSDYGINNHSGNFSAWLGGDPGEVTTITQRITLPEDATHLDYWYWINSNDTCDKNKATVTLDTLVLTYDLCQVTSDWANEMIAIPANLKGKTLDLIFKAETTPDPTGNLFSSFLLDDVSIVGTLPVVSLPSPAQPSQAGRPFPSVLRKFP